jgi:hypothetical protein
VGTCSILQTDTESRHSLERLLCAETRTHQDEDGTRRVRKKLAKEDSSRAKARSG